MGAGLKWPKTAGQCSTSIWNLRSGGRFIVRQVHRDGHENILQNLIGHIAKIRRLMPADNRPTDELRVSISKLHKSKGQIRLPKMSPPRPDHRGEHTPVAVVPWPGSWLPASPWYQMTPLMFRGSNGWIMAFHRMELEEAGLVVGGFVAVAVRDGFRDRTRSGCWCRPGRCRWVRWGFAVCPAGDARIPNTPRKTPSTFL